MRVSPGQAARKMMLLRIEKSYAMTIALSLFIQLGIVHVCGETFGVQQYCEGDEFKGTCARDEVVIATSAMYGRMNLGRCVQVNMGYIGCSADVLDLVDQRCSGKRECTIKVPDTVFEKTRPCLELKSYLEVSYTCLKVAVARPEVCQSAKYVKLQSPSGYLSSQVTKNTGCGTALCPWVIEVPKGQRINVTLLDFGRDRQGKMSSGFDGLQMCQKYAVLREMRDTKSVTICGSALRESHQYVSDSNQLEVYLTPKSSSDDDGQFLIHYEAFGCADLTTPSNAVFKRSNENEATVMCRYSSQSWSLRCKNSKWIGSVGNCTKYASRTSGQFLVGNVSMPHGIAIAIVAGVAIVIGMLILTVGLVVFKRHMHQKELEEESRHHQAVLSCPDDYDVRTEYLAPSEGDTGDYKLYGTPMAQVLPGQLQHISRDPRYRNEYTHIWEMPLPNPHDASSGDEIPSK